MLLHWEVLGMRLMYKCMYTCIHNMHNAYLQMQCTYMTHACTHTRGCVWRERVEVAPTHVRTRECTHAHMHTHTHAHTHTRVCRFVRALHYRYAYTKLGSSEASQGHWWKRSLIGQYLPIVSSRELKPVIEAQGWKWYTKKKMKSKTWTTFLMCKDHKMPLLHPTFSHSSR